MGCTARCTLFGDMDMTRYTVRDGLSFCQVDGHFVFLDVDSDRYFRLPDSLDHALATYLDGSGPPEADISGLVAQNILVDRPSAAPCNRQRLRPAARSAMEAPTSSRKLRPLELLEVLAVVVRTRVALKLWPLKVVLGSLGADPAHAAPHAAAFEGRLSEAAAVYRRARLYVPIDMCCLLDSVALATFLRKRRLHAHVVFGIALDPFSAHCWVQADDLVLNDTVGNVNSHTPIRVV